MRKNLLPFLLIALFLTGCVPTAIEVEPSAQPPATGSAVTAVTETGSNSALTYPIVDTAQGKCYDNKAEVNCPQEGAAFYGQDAQYTGNLPRYQDNGDGTVTDLITGLMWQQDPGQKMTYDQAMAEATSFNLAGYTDWRLPTIKELYSLVLFDGEDVSGCPVGATCEVTPFIDTRYFNFSYGDPGIGERTIDSQFATSTKYVSLTMGGEETMFGVNFADGRIKGYGTGPMMGQSGDKTFYVLHVRGNRDYGQNGFVENGDSTVTDNATGLTWTQSDSGSGMDWESALAYCEALDFAGSTDWYLPDVKQLQSIVDYSRSPDTTNSAAIDLVFNTSTITNESGQTDYPFYWSSTTHADSSGGGTYAAYVAFGRALGYINAWVDVHGAGAQRSDPKTGSASEYPEGHGPQGDAIRIENYVRCVRGGDVSITPDGNPDNTRPRMSVESTGVEQPQGNTMPGNSQQSPSVGAPPREASTACSASTQGNFCQFSTPTGTVSGTCQWIESQLACMPANPP